MIISMIIMLIMIITKVLEIKRYSPAPQNWKYILKKDGEGEKEKGEKMEREKVK